MVVIGRREAENNEVVLRRLGVQEQETLALDAAVATLSGQAATPA